MTQLLVINECSDFFENIKEFLQRKFDVTCFHATSETEARELLKQHTITKVLVNHTQNNVSSIDFLHHLNVLYTDISSVVLSEIIDPKHVHAVFMSGATGYLQSPLPFPKLLHHLQGWLTGIAPISPCIASKLINSYCNTASIRDNSCTSKKLTGFSKRECEVMSLMISGMDRKSMATKLHISNSTVASHIKNIYYKLNVSNRVSAINAITHANLSSTAKDGQELKNITQSSKQSSAKIPFRRRSTDI